MRENTQELEVYEECPTSALEGNRWIYRCNECDTLGCFDEVRDDGCFNYDEDGVNLVCLNCQSTTLTKFGMIGVGTDEE